MSQDMASEETTLQQLIDAWGTARIKRLAEQKVVDKYEEEEKKLKAQVIARMKAAKATSMGGLKYGANRDPNKTKPVAGDWSKIYAWIKENDAFDILQKRLTDTAIQARIEDKIEIPGIIQMPVDDITMFTV